MIKPPFVNYMTPGERMAGMSYLVLHVAFLPLFLMLYPIFFRTELSELSRQVLYYGAGLAFILIFLRRSLRAGFDTLLDKPVLCGATAAMALIAGVALSYYALLLLEMVAAGSESPAQIEVFAMAEGNFKVMFGLTVFIRPIVDEVLFRGVIFGSVREKNRILAYPVSAIIHGLAGMIPHVLVRGDLSLLVFGIQYIPPGLAFAWSYERTSSIWTPILAHMLLGALVMVISRNM